MGRDQAQGSHTSKACAVPLRYILQPCAYTTGFRHSPCIREEGSVLTRLWNDMTHRGASRHASPVSALNYFIWGHRSSRNPVISGSALTTPSWVGSEPDGMLG